MSDVQKLHLQLFIDLMTTAPPRQLVSDADRCILLFTDASYEPESSSCICGVGAVAISPVFGMQHFSLVLTPTQREKLGSLRKKQIIFEAETIAAVLAFTVWARHFIHRRCILFVDNEGTKHSLI